MLTKVNEISAIINENMIEFILNNRFFYRKLAANYDELHLCEQINDFGINLVDISGMAL